MIPFVICVLFFWTALNFTDYVFKTCMLYPYVSMLERSGMSLKLLRAQFYFTRFNRVVHQMGRKKPRFLYWWFTVGTVASIGCIVPALWVLVKTASGMIRSATTGTQEVQLPGVNLPLSDIFYYIATLIVCSIFHEFGHALAAVRENVRIQGCGFFVLGIFPGAFVDLPKDQVSVLSPWRQLKIYCAGVWHNIVAALLALLLLFGNKYLLAPFYAENSGVSVISVLKESGAHGPGGLLPGDHVIGIDGCDIRNIDSWKACLVQTVQLPQQGYCQKKSVVESEGTWTPKVSVIKWVPRQFNLSVLPVHVYEVFLQKGVYLVIVLGGTVLLASNVVLGFWKLFGQR
ncbi:hypothetical protein HPB52_020605 [Rhipicephalus sanguineus]|uniref:Membrane-bound transcription factor site-2 protease n=1 Tax=Rhipicephalus sanguineus TaxID=34632 RepID=A0A9D4PPV1_RHISA|nr:hypothetical protein HPB52_020605 [Rhipicephalus sanguineus]